MAKKHTIKSEFKSPIIALNPKVAKLIGLIKLSQNFDYKKDLAKILQKVYDITPLTPA